MKKSQKPFVFNPGRQVVDVTIVLNIWKRTHLQEQLNALLSQSVLPKEIWIIHYEKNVNIDPVVEEFKNFFENIVVINSDKNLRYFGRFSIAININTEFSCLIDDDVIPGEFWIENCVKKCVSLNSIVSCSGRILPPNNFEPELSKTVDRGLYFVGDIQYLFMNYCDKDTQVDYACNFYFLKTEWLKAYWSIWPATFSTGEDIHLSAVCKYVLGVNTYVIEQKEKQYSGNLRKIYGNDEVASWKHSNFVDLRRQVFEYHILNNGWKPILWN
jgi:hypothetical protein